MAVAVFDASIKGHILFSQNGDTLSIEGRLTGFQHYVKGTPGSKHGFHVHINGDLRNGCASGCQHYNPDHTEHGGLDDTESHAGDFGNIIVGEKGQCHVHIITSKVLLKDLIGRMLIIHADEDDLGRGNFSDSKTTGHAGDRIACAIIGLLDPEGQC